MSKDKIVSVQVPLKLLDRIDREIENGEYTTRSELIKVAIRMHLKYLEDTRVVEESDYPASYEASGSQDQKS